MADIQPLHVHDENFGVKPAGLALDIPQIGGQRIAEHGVDHLLIAAFGLRAPGLVLAVDITLVERGGCLVLFPDGGDDLFALDPVAHIALDKLLDGDSILLGGGGCD